MNFGLTLISLSSLAAFALSVQGADLTQYRDFRLGMPLAEVANHSATPASEVKVDSTRPARVEELDWRIGWSRPASETKSLPFSDVRFSFYNNALYRISVSYDRDRTRGLTDSDMLESISGVYGTATPVTDAKTPATIAQWEDEQTCVTLVRLPYYAGFGLILSSKGNQVLADQTILESARLDRIEAPKVEAALQAKRLADDQLADEKARSVNKAGFRP